MAHKMVIHAGNYGKGSVGALEHHNLRENETYSNKDINPERTKDNVTLKAPVDSQYQDTKNIIEQRAVNQVRKTSIWQSEFIISSDKDFFADMPMQEQNRFFEEAYNYLSKEFGEQNVTCAVVHYDETTPHMHFDFVPMTETNKLSRKEVMTRERLIKIQDELPKYLQEKGFQVERGRKMVELAPEERPKHIEPKEYKKALNEEIRALQGQRKQVNASKTKLQERAELIQSAKKELNQQAVELNKTMQRMRELPKAEKSITGKMQLSETEYKKLYAAAQFGIAAHHQQAELKKDNKELSQMCQKLQEENFELKKQVPTIKDKLHQNERLAKVDRLERENWVMKNALQELQKMKLPERAVEIVSQALKIFKKTIQRAERDRI